MVPGSSPAPLSQRPLLTSPNRRGKTQNTPQDRIPTSKTSSHQSHSQMGVPMRGCECADWYRRVFGLTRLPVTAPHHGDEDGGYTVLLADPRTRMLIDLHHHPDLREGRF